MKIKSVFIYNVDIQAEILKHTDSRHYLFENPVGVLELIESIKLIRLGHSQFDPYSENAIRFGIVTDTGIEVRTPNFGDDIELIGAILAMEGGEV
jgi:hypothetical protein